ncbi:TORTIFOLIA1-like protein 4 [Coffea eugenioides]|uniref:TORTIFOLIA1-like protein 4 n=1 Tax=Coffea eugenioides TaxID=49369 RepID=UPI000F6140F2|nr:TORTIFOLIA1-like protein 4 [Coffea eugenioides]
MAQLSRQQSDLKNRVITCLNKLSDRDTLPQASNELESIAKTLSNDGFAPFLTCLSATDSSDKSPVRRQCVRILGILSAAHGDALSPYLSKMLSSLLRRLRDPDSSVRSACVDAVSSIASHITRPPFSLISKPLIDCISHEQDYNAQIGASLCFAAAIEAAPEPDPAELKKLLPRLLKLVKNDCFKAKSALLSLVGSIARVGGASSKNVVNSLVSTMVEFLSSDDWSARKAAAEALGMLAVAERDFLSDFKSNCVAALESRRFDKVKVVRETMNRAMELWKGVPGVSDEVSDEAESKSSVKDFGSDDFGYVTPHMKKAAPRIRSPTSNTSSTTNNQKNTSLKSDFGKPKAARSCQADFKRFSECRIEVAVPENPIEQMNQNLGDSDSEDSESCLNRNFEAKCFPFNRNSDERSRIGSSKFGARVVPLYGNADCDSTALDINATDVAGSQKEFENLSLIQKQLRQIENQQSSLLDLLQSFIGHSQNGMNSLERRVNGLEKALDVMCSDLAISTGKITDTDATGNTCCMLPGAEFLSPKFWRKSDGQNFSSKVSFSNRCQSLNYMPNKYVNSESSKLESPIEKHQIGSVSAVGFMGDAQAGSRETPDSHSKRRINRLLKDADAVKSFYSGGLDRASHATCVQKQT